MARNDWEDDLEFGALAIAACLIFLNLFRSLTSATYAGGAYGGAGFSFTPAAPGADLANTLGLAYTISAAGRQNIKDEEKFSAYPYADGPGQSVGWGHQIQPGENFSYPLSFDVGEQVFESDIAKVESTINATVTVPLDQNQVDAIGDFIYRIGTGNWQKSQLLADLNAGNYAAAATDFSHFIKTNGQVSSALQARATNEQNLFSGVA
jgi:lysozyme